MAYFNFDFRGTDKMQCLHNLIPSPHTLPSVRPSGTILLPVCLSVANVLAGWARRGIRWSAITLATACVVRILLNGTLQSKLLARHSHLWGTTSSRLVLLAGAEE
jgi:hypothetical protein